MPRRHPLAKPLPRLWMMTDERQGNALWAALARLPKGSGVVVRHYSLSASERRALARKVVRIAQRRKLTVILAGSAGEARAAGADGLHRRSAHIGPRTMIRTVAVHNARELVLAHRIGADLVFVSPAFPTASHPGGKALGRVRFGMLARQSAIPVIALGGMTWERAQSLRGLDIYGWAGIGALTPKRD